LSAREEELRATLKGRSVLVTGAAGFVGSHLVDRLLELGADVHALIRPSSSGAPHNLSQSLGRIRLWRADITDKQSVSQVLKGLAAAASKEPIVFHLAGQSHVGESWNRPYETFNINAIGTLNLLQSIVDLKLPIFKLDTAGSSEEYGNVDAGLKSAYRYGADGGLILDTTSPLNPHSVYATSKVAADFLTRNYFLAYGVPSLVTRMFNNFGPRQNPRFITGTIITQALSRPYVELGYLGAKRDFCFVADGAEGHLHAAVFGNPGETYVYGQGNHISMADWYQLIISVGQKAGFWGEPELRIDEPTRGRVGDSEVMELRVDAGKLTALTGWKPSHSWEEGLKKTIAWYASNRERWAERVDWR
jgi:dTDP-glucose 4,6-dehydratase